MQHEVQAEGWGVRLRPVQLGDAEFIVWLRNLDHVKGRIGDSATTSAAQVQWLNSYFQRSDDYYFIIETLNGNPVGAYGIYDIRGGSAESGRWTIRPDVCAAIPSAILGFDIAFGRLGLDELRVRTVSTNHPVLSLNRRMGFRQTGINAAEQVIGGKPVDMVHYILKAEEWPPHRAKLLPMALVAEQQVADWQIATGA